MILDYSQKYLKRIVSQSELWNITQTSSFIVDVNRKKLRMERVLIVKASVNLFSTGIVG